MDHILPTTCGNHSEEDPGKDNFLHFILKGGQKKESTYKARLVKKGQ